MNRIYRKVWNRALGQWVVASELARGDSAGVTGARRRTLPHRLALVIALMAGGMTAGAQANTVIGSNSFVSPDGAICSAVGTPAANAVAAWTCQVPNGSSGYAIISGINATATGAPNLAGLASALGANAVLIGTTATRASADGTVAIGPDARATADTAIALGDRARATGVGAVALGFSARAEDEYSAAVGAGAVALGRSSYAMGNNAVARDFDVAIGAAALIGSTSSARTTAIGYQAGANAPNAVESSFIGFAAGAQSDGTSNTFIGSRAGFLATGDLNVANGTFALAAANGNHNVAQGNGAGALVTGDHNVAIGRQAGTLTTFAADGTPTVLTPAAFSESISIGREAGGLANRAIAIGAEAVATGTASIALGPAANTSATALDSVAIGRESTVIGAGSIAAGFGATAAADRSIAIGRSANTEGRFSVALGSNAEALDQHSIALGSARSEGQYSIAAGIGATARGSDTLAIGTNTLTGGFNAIAIGTGAQAEIDDAVALGSNAIADTPSGLAGYDPRTGLASTGTSSTWVSTLAAVSIGSAGNTRQITNVAAGTEATDAVNVAQLQAAQTRYYSVNDSFAASFPWPPSNYNNDGAQSLFGMAIGPYASALSGWDIAIGAGATTVNSIGFAGGAVALGGMATADVQGVAVGTLANVSAFGGAAVGAGANASGMLSVALGGGFVSWDVPNDVGDVSDPVDAFAGANASGDRAVAVGHNAIASLDDGVALGSNSVTTTAAGAAGYDPSTGAASANTSPTWVSTLAAVSVGGAGNTRQITNVAAGTEDTDAVNVAQLRAVSTAASAGWNATDAAGNTANIGPGGTVLFEGDANIAVSQTGTDDNGVVQITLNRDLDVDSVTAGGAVLDTAGLTIAGGPSVTIAGINAGGTVITNVAAGVAPTDAVNVSQLTTVETAANAGWNATDAAGNTANIGPNGTVTFESGNANIAVSQNGTDDDGVVDITLSNDLDLTSAGSVTTGDTVVNNAGVAVGTNVALGSGGLTVIGGTTTTIVSGTGVSSGNVVLSGVSNDITGLSNRTLADPTFATAGRAATEEQLQLVEQSANAGWNATDAVGNTANIGPGGTVTFESGNANIAVSQTGADDDGVVDITLSNDLDLTAAGSVTTGDTVVNNAGVAVGTNVALGSGGLTVIGATTTTIVSGTGVSSGNVVLSGVSNDITGLSNRTLADPTFATAGRAATEEQLQLVEQSANAGWNATDAAGNTANIGPGGTVTFESGNANIAVSQTGTQDDGVVDITLSNDLDLTSAGSVTTGDTVVNNAGVAVGTNVALGSASLTVIGGTTTTVVDGDGFTSGSVALSGVSNDITGLSNRTLTDPTFATAGRAATEEQLQLVEQSANAGWNATDAAGNTANIGPGGTVTFEGDANIAVSQTGVDDDGVVAITLNRDLDVDSVTAGDTVLDTDGLTITGGPSVTIAGINAGGTVITNVAAGVAPTDAVNVSQLTTVETAANAGWNATDAAGNTANIGPDGTVTFESGNANIAVSQTGADDDGVVDITLSNNLDLTAAGTVTTGDTLVNNAGVTVGTNVALGSGGLTVIGGTTTTIVSGTGVSSGNVVLSGVSNDITGLSNRTLIDPTFATAGRAATEEQLRLVRNEITSGFTPPTRYYGVNSLGGGNQLGEGATGEDAMALGKDAESEGQEAVAMGRGARATEDDSMALGTGSQALSLNALAIGAGAVASHENSIALGAGSATTVGARTGYQGAYVGSSSSTGEMNIGGRQLTGVAAGSAATDAVNVSQLQGGVTQAITEANNYTDARIATIEGDLVDIRGDITDIQGDIVRIEGDITNLDTRVGDVEGDVANLTTTVNQFDNRVTNLERGGSGPFQVTQGETYVAPAPTGANASAGGNGAVASGDNSTAVGNQSVASGDNSTAIGQGAVASHDNSVALGRGSATTVGAQRGYDAAYVGTSTSTGEVNIGGRTISGVAPGIAGTDAVNVNQLNAGVDYAINQANAYTDNRFNQFEGDMWNLERGYRGGTASAMAMAGLPQAYLPGKSMLSVAFGGYQGEYGMAFGLSTISDNGRWVYKAQATGNTTRDWGFSVGAGLQW